MAQSFTTNSGVTIKIPGTYVEQKVISNVAGVGLAGVVTLIGEADEGPDFTKELNLDQNVFGPDEINEVISKYGSGRLVEAFRVTVSASGDAAINGSVTAIKLVKVNVSTSASAVLARAGFGNFAVLTAKREGANGNLIKFKSDVFTAEMAPTTNIFTYMPHYETSPVSFSIRQNGSNPDNISIGATVSGPAFASLVEDLNIGTLVIGATEKFPLTGMSGNISVSVINPADNTIQINLPSAISAAHVPQVGDCLVIPQNSEFGATADSVIIGSGSENRGSYIITAVSNSAPNFFISARRINAPSGAPTVVSVAPTAISSVNEFIVYRQAEIKNLSGQDRQCTVGLSSVTFNTILNSGSNFTMNVSVPWATQPKIGDYVKFLATFAGVNAGFYRVTNSTTSSFTCQRLSNGSSGTTGTSTVPGVITQSTQPFLVLRGEIDGLGKSMEIEGNLGLIAKNPTTGNSTLWATSEPLIISAAEYKNLFIVSRGDSVDEFVAGGDVVISFASNNANSSVQITDSAADFYIGSSLHFSVPFAQFKTLKDVADFVNSQTGFYATVKLPAYNLLPPTVLDRGTYAISASKPLSNQPGRIKKDAYDWQFKVNTSPMLSANLVGFRGLPEFQDEKFLSGGSKGGSSSSQWVSAIDACESIDTNFLVSLVSNDSSVDINLGETESSSTYSVDAINMAMKSHVLKMSAIKSRRNRIAIVSRGGAYNDQKNAAAQLASHRVAMTFQKINALGSDGTIKTFDPWLTACVATGMQAAAGAQGIVKKFANVTGVLHDTFNPRKTSDLEDAISSGLLILEPVNTGGFRWVSDQTTYSVDSNFVYNSLQAVYLADLMTLSLITVFDRVVVGQSVATMSAAAALGVLEQQLFNFNRLGWIAASDDAPAGFKNARVKLTGGVMQVSVEVKLAGLIYFVPIQFELSQVQQTT